MQPTFVTEDIWAVCQMGIYHLQAWYDFGLLWTCVGVASLEVPLDRGYLKTPCSGLLFARSGGGLLHATCICH